MTPAQSPARRIAYESKVLDYRTGSTRWAEVHEFADGHFEATLGHEWYDRNGDRDYEWETTKHATREEAFAAAGLRIIEGTGRKEAA